MSRDDLSFVLELDKGWYAAAYPDGPAAAGRMPQTEGADWFGAEVPGAVQYDLIRIGKLSNPYASSKAVQAAEWVHQSDWVFRQRFDFDTDAEGQVYLEADGIDTFADLWLNGAHIGSTANAYRAYRFEIDRSLLKESGNELLVHIKAHKRMVEHLVPEAKRRLGPTFKYKGLIRRYQRSFFSGSSLLNLGGEVLGIGIYKPIRLVVVPSVRIEDSYFETRSIENGQAVADVTVALNTLPKGPARIAARLFDPATGKEVASQEVAVDALEAKLELTVRDAKLWWPRGYGAPNRYRLEIDLLTDTGRLSRNSRLVGLRTSRIATERESGRPNFQIVVNEKPVHARGHNIIPVDYIKVHGSKSAYEQMIRLVCDSNSNIIRIWGGGGIESADFYDMCDAEGIMIWQDFYLHSTTYPDYDPEWVAEYGRECEDLLRLLRNHPCLTVICGGNEQYEGWDEWGWRGEIDRFYGETLFTEVGKQAARKMTPALPYVLNSPHAGNSCQAPALGDVHNWGNFYNSTKDPMFVTETCWSQESYSRVETLERVMDLDLAAYSTLGWPERWKELTGRPLVTRLPYSGGPLVTTSLAEYIKCLEIEQAIADHHALSNLLLRSPSSTGLVYWPLNKGGPLFQFGCVDYLGYPLASYYVIKRLFADTVLTIYRDVDDIRVIGVNRGSTPVEGMLEISHQRADGTILNTWEKSVTIPGDGRARLVDLDGYYGHVVDRNGEVMKARLIVDGRMVSQETLLFTPLMEFPAKPNTLTASIQRTSDTSWEMEVHSDSLVKLFYAEGNQKVLLSDNYFTLSPSEPRRLRIELVERVSEAPATLRLFAMDGREDVTLSLE